MTRQGPRRRQPRLSNFALGAIVLAVVLVVTALAFKKEIPFRHHYVVHREAGQFIVVNDGGNTVISQESCIVRTAELDPEGLVALMNLVADDRNYDLG